MAVPPAPIRLHISIPIPVGTVQAPSHCVSTKPYPRSPPASPPRRIEQKAITRAATDGRAEREEVESGT